jgi:hypothetical protein
MITPPKVTISGIHIDVVVADTIQRYLYIAATGIRVEPISYTSKVPDSIVISPVLGHRRTSVCKCAADLVLCGLGPNDPRHQDHTGQQRQRKYGNTFD